MLLNELHSQAMKFSPLEYDKRLNHIMTEEQFESYKINKGHTYYLYLYNLMRLLGPKNALELGTSIGRSAFFMMCALPENSTLTTVEIGSHLRVDLEPFFNDPRLKIVYGSDMDENVYSPLNLQNIEFMYIDTEHNINQLQKEWGIYKNFLCNNAIVVLDDISLNDGMKQFWDNLPYEKISCPLSVHFSGFGIFKYDKVRG